MRLCIVVYKCDSRAGAHSEFGGPVGKVLNGDKSRSGVAPRSRGLPGRNVSPLQFSDPRVGE